MTGANGLAAAGALLAALAVAFGAFGAHAVQGRLGVVEQGWWATAGHYLLPHAVAVVAIALAGRPALFASGWLLAAGSLLFAATLYAMSLGSPRWLGAVTPIGGTLMIAGWLWLAWQALREG